MKKIFTLCVLAMLCLAVNAQYSGLSVSADKTNFCSQSSLIHVTGRVTAQSGVSNGYHFVGMIFRFYYLNGSQQPIGTYTINTSGFSASATYANQNPVYFNGSQLGNPQVLQNSYNASSPSAGGTLMLSFILPWAAFPTSTGQQFYVAVEAIDQIGSTTVVSSRLAFSNPILYPNAPLSKPSIAASANTICGSENVTISTSPDLTGTYAYNWYKDGNWLSSETGASITTSSPGTYYAYIYDNCQNVTTDPVTITSGTAPGAPNISSSNGTLLCNGASTILSTSPSAGGTIHWSTGETGNSISVSAGGTYYAWEENGCGTSPYSNTITISTASTPGAPSVNSSNGTLLCNGASTTLSTSPSYGGAISWSTGATGNSISVSAAGNYYAVESNGCGMSGASNTISIAVSATPGAPSVSSSAENFLCNGASTVLSTAPSAGGTIHWSTGATGNTINVSSAGSYYAYETNGCGNSVNSNTINISTGATPPAPSVNSSNGSSLCNGATTTLSTAPAGGGTIHWSTGQTGNSITVSGAGSYYAYETNGCGSSPNSNVVTITTGSTPPAPAVSPGANQLLCNGASVTLSASGSSISWSNGSTGNSITVSTAGNYYAVDHNGCGYSAPSSTVTVTTGTCPSPLPGGSFFICPGTSKTLDAGAGYDSYSWSNGATSRTISVGPGTYTVTVSKEGCYATSNAVTVNYYSVTTPTISASGPTTICASSSVTLSASAGSTYLWSNGATGSSITVNSPGGYYVTVTDANGCQSNSASVQVTVNPLPSASISGNASVCQNASSPSVTFTGSNGTAPYFFIYKINGGANQMITTTSGNSVSVGVPTGSAGTYVYSLVAVQESSSTSCANGATGSATITVNPLPTASISGSTTICQNSAQPSIVLTGNGGSAPYTFSYKVNGGSLQTVSTVSGNSVSVAVPTTSAGSFVYSLVSVQESSATFCSNAASGSATVTVNPLPSASISGTTTVCLNSIAPLITFTGSNGVAPYTFSYRIGSGSVQTVSTTSGNSVTVSVPTTTAGSFVYTLLSVQDAGSTACSNTASGTATVTVNDLPTASVSGSTSVCQNSASPSITFTANGGSAPYTFYYKINGGTTQTVTTVSGNSVSVGVSTNTPGSFVYTLVGVQGGCSNTASGSATVTVNPLPAATISGTATVCQNGASPVITFTGSGGTAPYTFSYTINSGAVQTIATVSGSSVTVNAPVSTAGSFVYQLVSVQDAGSTACVNPVSGSITITVNALPVKAVIASPLSHLCNGSAGQITVINFVSGQTYAWYKDGVFLSSSTEDHIQVTDAGSYTVVPTNANGCASATQSDPVIITTGSVAKPVITGSLHVCPQGKTRLAGVPPNIETAFEIWRWTDTPYGRIKSEDSVFFADAGQYQLRVSNEGCYDSVTVTVAADDTEFPAGRLTITPEHLASGAQATLTAEVTGAVQYEWTLGDGNTASGTNNILHQNYFTSGDSIRVSVRAISERNCATAFTGYIKVDPPVFDTLVDRSVTGNLKDWNVFPTPFRDHVKVSVILNRDQQVRIDLFTAEGKWIRSWKLSGSKGENLFTLDNLSGLSGGVLYFITGVYNNQKHFDKIFKY